MAGIPFTAIERISLPAGRLRAPLSATRFYYGDASRASSFPESAERATRSSSFSRSTTSRPRSRPRLPVRRQYLPNLPIVARASQCGASLPPPGATFDVKVIERETFLPSLRDGAARAPCNGLKARLRRGAVALFRQHGRGAARQSNMRCVAGRAAGHPDRRRRRPAAAGVVVTRRMRTTTTRARRRRDVDCSLVDRDAAGRDRAHRPRRLREAPFHAASRSSGNPQRPPSALTDPVPGEVELSASL